MLVHICCSVDSHFFLQKLQNLYPNETLLGFFYDPNIHPFSEYQLRLLDVRRSCKKLGIKLYEGTYNYEAWIDAVRGLEDEPEKGKRCLVCFDNRLEETAKKALELGESVITTTLLTSPKKSLEQLAIALERIAKRFGLESIAPDFRKKGGTQEQFALAKAGQLYHQDYCGCFFALSKQRDAQERWKDELSSPVRAQILPSSIEERLGLYSTVIEYEEKKISFKLVREKFLNYRLLRAWVKNKDEEIVPSYVLFYSCVKKEKCKGSIDNVANEKAFFTKEEIVFVSLCEFNTMMQTSFTSVKQMVLNPPKIETEIDFRVKLLKTPLLTLSPIIILDTLEIGTYEVYLLSKTYQDIREILV